jgi:hypothetical protein
MAFMPAQAVVAQFLQTFKEFPPRAQPGSFNLDQVLQKMQPRPTTRGDEQALRPRRAQPRRTLGSNLSYSLGQEAKEPEDEA